jgi:hypothetical protein
MIKKKKINYILMLYRGVVIGIVIYLFYNDYLKIEYLQNLIIIIIIFFIYKMYWKYIEEVLFKIGVILTKGKNWWKRDKKLSKKEIYQNNNFINYIYIMSIISNPLFLIWQIGGIYYVKVVIKMQCFFIKKRKYINHTLSVYSYRILKTYLSKVLKFIIKDPILRIFYFYYNFLNKWKNYKFREFFFLRVEGYIIIFIYIIIEFDIYKRVLVGVIILIILIPVIGYTIDKVLEDKQISRWWYKRLKKFMVLCELDVEKVFVEKRSFSFLSQFIEKLNKEYLDEYGLGWERYKRRRYLKSYEYYTEVYNLIINGYYCISYYNFYELLVKIRKFEFCLEWINFYYNYYKKDYDFLIKEKIEKEFFIENVENVLRLFKEYLFDIWDLAEYFEVEIEKEIKNMIIVYKRDINDGNIMSYIKQQYKKGDKTNILVVQDFYLNLLPIRIIEDFSEKEERNFYDNEDKKFDIKRYDIRKEWLKKGDNLLEKQIGYYKKYIKYFLYEEGLFLNKKEYMLNKKILKFTDSYYKYIGGDSMMILYKESRLTKKIMSKIIKKNYKEWKDLRKIK